MGRDHTIKVYDTKGYEDYTDTFYMDYNGDTVTLQIYLVPVATETAASVTTSSGTGAVRVFVSPGLGQVCIDNRECESSTGAVSTSWNVDFDDVTAGSAHTITVTADGYQTATTQITILPDQVNEADITLQPIPSAADTSIPKTQAGSGGLVALVAAGICGMVFVGKHGE
ncbi:PEGA domain-containing protein [Methanoregula sp.]|uniref:PEGA domain-containing protein n=1 Tax=Methanoregula sp. TaxID=2052170 RepID=UPI003562E783